MRKVEQHFFLSGSNLLPQKKFCRNSEWKRFHLHLFHLSLSEWTQIFQNCLKFVQNHCSQIHTTSFFEQIILFITLKTTELPFYLTFRSSVLQVDGKKDQKKWKSFCWKYISFPPHKLCLKYYLKPHAHHLLFLSFNFFYVERKWFRSQQRNVRNNKGVFYLFHLSYSNKQKKQKFLFFFLASLIQKT